MTTIIHDNAYDKGKPCVLFDNILSQGTLTTTSGDGLNAISGSTWDFWTGVGLSTLTIDMGADTEVDCLFVDAHNLFTVGRSLVWQYYNGASWVTIETVTPTDNTAIMVLVKDITATQFRVTATGADIGVVMMGKRLVFPNGTDASHSSIQHSKRYELLGGNSDAGQFTNQMVVRKSATLSVTFPLLDADWVDTEMKQFEEHYNIGKPFAWAANPAFRGDDIGYCQRPSGAGELSPMYYEGGMYEEFSMSLAVYINE